MDPRPKSKAKTVRLLEGSIGVNLCDFGFGDEFLDMTPKAQTTKWKKKNWTSLTLKTTFSFKRYTIKKLNRQPAEWVKIFPNHRSSKNT